MWNQEELQRLLRPLVALVSDLKALLPGTAIGVIEGQEVINIQQLMEEGLLLKLYFYVKKTLNMLIKIYTRFPLNIYIYCNFQFFIQTYETHLN